MKKVYIVSPFRAVLDHNHPRSYAEHLAVQYARNGSNFIKQLGYFPISPILAFQGIYDEYKERETINQACAALLLSCDAIFVVNTPYNQYSKGIKRELEIAAQNNIPTIEGEE